MREEWVELEEFPGWSISSEGYIRNDHTRRLLKLRSNRQGFVMVGLVHDRSQYIRSVAKLVAEHFVANPMPKYFNSIIHLNGDRSDCRAINLMWRSRSFALRYHDMFNDQPARLAVRRSDTGEYFGSLREACTTYGLIENIAYTRVSNHEPCFPYGWYLERAN